MNSLRMEYENFDLEIGPGNGMHYPVAVLNSPAGEAREIITFPYTDEQIQLKLKDLEIAVLRSSGSLRTARGPGLQLVQDMGRDLFNALMSGDIRLCYYSSLAHATEDGKGLRIRLQIKAPDLATLPWEYLYDPVAEKHVCLSTVTPLVRYLDAPQWIQRLRVELPLRVLGMVCAPSDLKSLDVAHEKKRVEDALQPLLATRQVELTWLEKQTWRDLQMALRKGPWHVFHFIGRGGFDPTADEGFLSLTNVDGLADNIRATELARLLADHRTLHVVLLNTCEGDRSSWGSLFSSTAEVLVRRGITTVLAMQFAISDGAAVELTRVFYEALADGSAVDIALGEARKAISLAHRESVEWGTPLLFTRSPNNVLFQMQSEPISINQSVSSMTAVTSFTQGHALLIGVGNYINHPQMNVPAAIEAAHILRDVLTDPRYCAYPAIQVNLLIDQIASRTNILTALADLATRTSREDTVVLFYSGYGVYDTDGIYTLTAYDTRIEGGKVIQGTGVSEEELLECLRVIPANRLVFFVDASYSGALSKLQSTDGGIAILAACSENQHSYIGKGKVSIFTQSLIDGLKGKGVSNINGYIGLYNIYEYIFKTVKEAAKQLGIEQDPVLTIQQGTGSFAVAPYKGHIEPGSFDINEELPLEPVVRLVSTQTSRKSTPLKEPVQKRTEYADLEIAIHRSGSEVYFVELRFSMPDSDADTRIKTVPVHFDFEGIRATAFDPSTYGQALSRMVFDDPSLRTGFAEARAIAEASGYSLRLRLLIGNSALELHSFYWELLVDPSTGTSLVTDQSILFSRYLTSSEWRPVRLRGRSDLRALVVIACPGNQAEINLAPIDVQNETARVINDLSGIHVDVLASGNLERVTLNQLVERLHSGFDIIYLVAQGAVVRGEYWLILEDEDGRAMRINGTDLVVRIRELETPPRLVVLMTPTQSSSFSTNEGTNALGPRLVEANIPAVLCIQGAISLETSSILLPLFFQELQRDGQVDRALAVARAAVSDRPDFWMPVLFSRLKSGRLWYTPGLGQEERAAFEVWPAILSQLEDKKVIPILGPGISEDLFGSRREIARSLAETFNYPFSPNEREDLARVTQYVAERQGKRFVLRLVYETLQSGLTRRYPELNNGIREPLADLLEKTSALRVRQGLVNPAFVMAQMPFSIYITLCYDSLLENALKNAGKDPQVFVCRWDRDKLHAKDQIFEPSLSRPLVVHLLGDLHEPETLVLTEDDYFDVTAGLGRDQDVIPIEVRAAISECGMLCVGFEAGGREFQMIRRGFFNSSRSRSWYTHLIQLLVPEDDRNQSPEQARQAFERTLSADRFYIFWGTPQDFTDELWSQWQALKKEEPKKEQPKSDQSQKVQTRKVKSGEELPVPKTISDSSLYRLLIDEFDEAELKDLCFDLIVDWDKISGKTTPAKVKGIIRYLKKQKRVDDLVQGMLEARPNIASELELPPKQTAVTKKEKKPFTRLTPPALTYTLALTGLPEQMMVGQKSSLRAVLRPTLATEQVIQLPNSPAHVHFFLRGDGVRVHGPESKRVLFEPGKPDPGAVEFEIQARLVGKRAISIAVHVEDLSSKQETIHQFTQSFVVLRPESGEDALPVLLPIDVRAAPQPDMLLVIKTSMPAGEDGPRLLNYHLTSRFDDSLEPNRKVGNVLLALEDISRLQSIFQQAICQARGSSPTEGYQRLLSLGTYLYDRLFPVDSAAEFRAAFWQAWSTHQTWTWLIIEDGEVWLPWEMVAPYRRDQSEPPRLLGEHFRLGRWPEGLGPILYNEIPFTSIAIDVSQFKEQPGEHVPEDDDVRAWRLALHADPTYGIQQAIRPETIVYGLHMLRRAAETVARTEIIPRADVITHDNLEEQEISRNRLNLRSKRPLVTFSLLDTPSGGPLEWLLPNRAVPFLRAGASAVIGPWWPTSEEADLAFWSSFYDLFPRHLALGEAVRQARLEVLGMLPDRPDWMAYTLFGDPRARTYWPEKSEGYATLECINADTPMQVDKDYQFEVSIARRPPAWYNERVNQVTDLPENVKVVFLTPTLPRPSTEPVVMQRYGQALLRAVMNITPHEQGNHPLMVHLFENDEPLATLQLTMHVGETGPGN